MVYRHPRRRQVGLLPLLRIVLLLSFLHGNISSQTIVAQSVAPNACTDGTQKSGAIYRICMPDNWNGKLLVYAHGYVAPNRPVGIPEDQLGVDGSPTVIELANNLGYGFVMSSYRANGLAMQEAIADLVDAVAIFTAQEGEPTQVLLAGVSEGGAITALAIERHPEVFDGGLAMCGPYGSFRDQIAYFGDFRVVFDQFFPALLPPTPVDIPASLLETWESSYYSTTVQPVISDTAQITAVNQLLTVTGAPFDAADPTTKVSTIERLLWYNVFATNDASVKLGGQPFDNRARVYVGSSDDSAFNEDVARYDADTAAITALAAYETTGRLTRPLITLHTSGDPVVPVWQATRYDAKIAAAGRNAFHEAIVLDAYGHCQFTGVSILSAFSRLTTMVDNPPPFVRYLPLIQN